MKYLRRILILVVFVLMLSLVSNIIFATCSNGEYIQDVNTVALWHFNEGSGTIVYDSTGNHNGTLTGANYSLNSIFNSNYSIYFDGINDYVGFNPPAVNNLTQGTAEMWIYPLGAPTGTETLLQKVGSGGGRKDILIEYLTNKQIEVIVGNVILDSSSFLENDTWTHIAVTWDGSNMKLYLNGNLDNTIANTQSVPDWVDGVYLGVGYGVINYFNGYMDEVRISNIVRTDFNCQQSPSIDSFMPLSLTQTINEGDTLQFTQTSSDLNNDTLTYSWLLDNTQVATTQNYTYTTDYSSSGNHTIKLIVSDGTLQVTNEWNIIVNNIDNTAPTATLDLGGITSMELGQTLSISCSGTDDINMSSVSLTVDGNNLCSGQIACSATYIGGSSGNKLINCTATDTSNNQNSQNVTIIVNTPPTASSGTSGGSGGGSSGGGSGASVTNLGELQSLKEIETRKGAEVKFKIGDSDYSFIVISADKDSLTLFLNGISYTIKKGESFNIPLANTQNKDVAFTFNNLDFGDISLSLEAVEQKPAQGESTNAETKEEKQGESSSNSQSSSGSSESSSNEKSSGMTGITGGAITENKENNVVVEKVKEVIKGVGETIVTIGYNIKEFVKEILNLK